MIIRYLLLRGNTGRVPGPLVNHDRAILNASDRVGGLAVARLVVVYDPFGGLVPDLDPEAVNTPAARERAIACGELKA